LSGAARGSDDVNVAVRPVVDVVPTVLADVHGRERRHLVEGNQRIVRRVIRVVLEVDCGGTFHGRRFTTAAAIERQ
jgi:hypothetical protein